MTDLDAALARFGHDAWRPGQREAVETLLGQRKLLLVAPTGGGKSLTYQLPASILDGTTLVISPLIALMHDQVAALDRIGVRSTFLASTLGAPEARKRFRSIAEGQYDLVYVAPERLALSGFRSLLADMACPLIAIDEAHCISEWGHDFRPEYLGIGEVLPALPDARVLACTATATPVVRDEILTRLGLGADTPQIIRGFARPNLSLRALEIGSAAKRAEAVDATLAATLGGPDEPTGCAILYAMTRRDAEEEAARLLAAGWRANHYHAGLGGKKRSDTQSAFTLGHLDVVVATNAFGMGIDRSDVRAVVHLGPPSSLEAYYQEVGRAGRDGEPAVGLLLHRSQDLPRRRHLLEMDSEGGRLEHKWNLFMELMRWADTGTCRQKHILRYFGTEEHDLADCGVCDVCIGAAEAGALDVDDEEATLIVRKALSGVARVSGRYGLTAASKLLAGQRDKRLEQAGLSDVKTFGVLREHDEGWLQRLIRRLVTAGWVAFEGVDRPVVKLTSSGRRVMNGDGDAVINLPPKGPGTTAARKRVREEDELDDSASELFQALRSWRMTAAQSREVPAYVVASDRTLRDIATRRPRTPQELLDCHGIGPSKLDTHGDAILELVNAAG